MRLITAGPPSGTRSPQCSCSDSIRLRSASGATGSTRLHPDGSAGNSWKMSRNQLGPKREIARMVLEVLDSGHLQAGVSAGYDPLYLCRKVTEVTCHVHARRRFVEAANAGDPGPTRKRCGRC